MFIAQPKLNGSNTLIFTNGEEMYVMNRREERLTRFNMDKEEIKSLHRGNGWMVINSEYMNKAQSDSKGENFNNNLVIFDILVFENEHLVGKTFQQRITLLDNLYGTKDSENEKFLYDVSDNVYREELYNDLVDIDMYEGVVIKRKRGKLENGLTENNTIKSQIKCRKPTKNYKF